MAYDAAVALKSLSNTKSSQTARTKKAESAAEDAFGQALVSASGATSEYRSQDAQTAAKPDGKGAETDVQAEAAQETSVQPEEMQAAQGGADAQAELAQKLVGVETGQFMQSMQAVQNVQAAGEAGSDQAQGVQIPQEAFAAVQAESAHVPEERPAQEPELFAGAEAAHQEAAQDVPAQEGRTEPQPMQEQPVQAVQVQASSQEAGSALSEEPEPRQETAAEDAGQTQEAGAQTLAGSAAVHTTAYTDTAGVQETAQEQPHVTQTGEMSEEYADMLKDLIAKQITSGRQEIELSLTPRSLGNLTVRVAYEAGQTTVSIICSNEKAMNTMSQKAGELGQILEGSLGSRMEVVVDTDNRQESDLYREDTGGYREPEDGGQGSKEQRGRQDEGAKDPEDFLQQLRLGLA